MRRSPELRHQPGSPAQAPWALRGQTCSISLLRPPAQDLPGRPPAASRGEGRARAPGPPVRAASAAFGCGLRPQHRGCTGASTDLGRRTSAALAARGLCVLGQRSGTCRLSPHVARPGLRRVGCREYIKIGLEAAEGGGRRLEAMSPRSGRGTCCEIDQACVQAGHLLCWREQAALQERGEALRFSVLGLGWGRCRGRARAQRPLRRWSPGNDLVCGVGRFTRVCVMRRVAGRATRARSLVGEGGAPCCTVAGTVIVHGAGGSSIRARTASNECVQKAPPRRTHLAP